MKFSIVNDIRTAPFKGGYGVCEGCGKPTIAKCGVRLVHHWAHQSLTQCDKWWESETQWHRDWKNVFPDEWQEIIHHDELTGEIHRADIKTNYNLVVELQNSPISYQEQISREDFYKNMIWIVNGKDFRHIFSLDKKLPSPHSTHFNDIEFLNGDIYMKYSENPKYGDSESMVQIHGVNEIQDLINLNHTIHYTYKWKNKRKNWLLSRAPVFIDFGDEFLYRLILYKQYKLNAVELHRKQDIIKRLLNKGNY